jgi:gliding motility-associated-like protein
MMLRRLFALCILTFVNLAVYSQLCTGSLGDPVVNITFGSGTNPGPPLNTTTTNLQYTTDPCAVNGFYTLVNSMKECNYGWHVLQQDHTGNANGYFMLIDASFEPSVFYLDNVKGLCPNTTYEFGAWILNLKKVQNGIRPDIGFTIETTDGVVLATYHTGDVPPEDTPKWRQYGFFFTTTASTTSIVLRMANRAPGGDGNDLALDDITFRPCGPKLSTVITGYNGDAITVCEKDTASIQLKATVSAGYNSPVYQWQLSNNNGGTWADITGANSLSYTLPKKSAGIFQYRLTVAEAGNLSVSTCRVASNAITVNINANPVLKISNNSPVCSGTQAVLTASGGNTYQWKGPNNFVANTATINVNGASQPDKYYVEATTIAGCKNIDSATVVVFATPTAFYANSIITCEKNGISFNDASTVSIGTIVNWQWNFGDGATSGSQNTSHTYAAGSYQVSLIVKTDKGCYDTLLKTIAVHPLPTVDFILPEVCLNDAFANFTDASKIADNNELLFLYKWKFGDAKATVANPDSSTQKNPKHSYSATGIYNVMLAVTSKDGCYADTTKPFTVNGAIPLADFNLGTSNFCSNEPVVLTNKSSVNFGSIVRLELYWDALDNNTLKIDKNPAYNTTYENQYAIFGNPATKDISIKLVAYSGISCVSTSVKTITLKASPQLQFNDLASVCKNIAPFNITAAANTNALTGTGQYSGNGISHSPLFDPTLAGAGTHTIRYTFTATNNCQTFLEKNITVLEQPLADAGPDRTVLEGGSIVLNANATGNAAYLWSPNIAIDNVRTLNPKVSPPSDQTYTLTVTSPDNCTNSDDVFVKVLKTPLVPNAFSPNGDGINDVWAIRYLDSYPDVDVQVYDRYGQLVYRSKNYNNPWDGTRNNKPLPAGTYYYIIDRKVSSNKLTGSVTIIR